MEHTIISIGNKFLAPGYRFKARQANHPSLQSRILARTNRSNSKLQPPIVWINLHHKLSRFLSRSNIAIPVRISNLLHPHRLLMNALLLIQLLRAIRMDLLIFGSGILTMTAPLSVVLTRTRRSHIASPHLETIRSR
jgi:hypothetical protein